MKPIPKEWGVAPTAAAMQDDDIMRKNAERFNEEGEVFDQNKTEADGHKIAVKIPFP